MLFHMCQINTTVGNFENNSKKIIEIISRDNLNKHHVFIFPELTLCGYPPLDLIDKKSFIKKQNEYFQRILHETKENPALILIGYIEENTGPGKDYFNSVAVCQKGEIIYNYRKRLLPTYDVFDEARYFESGAEPGIFFYNEKRIGLVICEDLWYKNKIYTINPAEDLFKAGVDFVISINSSPSTVGKFEQKKEMVKSISKKYGLPIIYVNQVGGNDDIVFDGSSFIVNKRGIITSFASNFEEEIHDAGQDALEYHTVNIPPKGFEPNYYSCDAEFFYKQAICGIRDYIRKCNFQRVVIGESGGIDSAVVTAVAANALGPENVTGITMPSKFSSRGSYEDSELLCKNLGVKLYTFPIKSAFDILLNDFNEIFGTDKFGLMEENLQARIRGQLLMSFSNRFGHLVLSTGNKSELSVGYCTISGDMTGGLAPISDLYKMEVYALAKYFNEYHNKEIIPQIIIDKEPTADLSPGQKDTDSLPPYPILDDILKYIIEGDTLEDTEKRILFEKVSGYNIAVIQKVLSLVKKAEFKRRVAAITIKMHSKAFGYGRRIPIAQGWEMTLD